MAGSGGFAKARLSDHRKAAAAFAAFFAVEIAIWFAVACYGTFGPHNLVYLLVPIPLVVLPFFRDAASRLFAAAALFLLIWPAGIAAETVAHLLGGCLY